MKDAGTRPLLDQELDLLLGHGSVVDGGVAEEPEDEIVRRAQQAHDRAGERCEEPHRLGDRDGDALRIAERQALRYQFADHERQIRNQRHDEPEAERVLYGASIGTSRARSATGAPRVRHLRMRR